MKFSYKHLFWIALITTFFAFSWSIYAQITKTDIVYDNSLFVEQLIFNSNSYDTIPPDTSFNTDLILSIVSERDRRGTKKSTGTWEGNSISKNVGRLLPEKDTRTRRITQSEIEHVKQWNGSMFAIDIVHDDGNAYLPDSHSEYVITHIGQDERIGDYIIIRNDKERWVYGHTVTSRSKGVLINVEKHGHILGQSNLSGVSTALHSHVERWICKEQESRMKDCDNVSSTWAIAPRNEALKAQRGWVEDSKKEIVEAGTEVKVIKCLNEKDMTLHDTKGWNCFLGKGWRWKNIMLPPQSHLDIFKKTFGDDYKYRLAIANFDWAFNESTENQWAKGYLQTLKSHNVPPDIVSQLNWLAKREIGTTGRICDMNDNVPYGWDTKLDRFTCMARGHFGFHKPDSKHYAHGIIYGKRYRVVTEYYLTLTF